MKSKQRNDMVIKFKARSPNSNRLTNNFDNSMEGLEYEIPIERRQTLSNVMRKHFEKIKINDLKNPSKLENHVEEKFVRDKSKLSMVAENLNREICKKFY
jgi:hypothetical protein